MTNNIHPVLAKAQFSYPLSSANFSASKKFPKIVLSLKFLSLIPFSNALFLISNKFCFNEEEFGLIPKIFFFLGCIPFEAFIILSKSSSEKILNTISPERTKYSSCGSLFW